MRRPLFVLFSVTLGCVASSESPRSAGAGGDLGTGGDLGGDGSVAIGGAGETDGGAGFADQAVSVVDAGGAGAHCTNGLVDADETGVDCGGNDCPSCAAAYKMNPPDPCQNQFYVSGCTPGKADSTCGGICQSQNGCQPQGSGATGYVCSRTMLFSPAMRQAAEDDAKANGWTSPSEPPFFYGVVGHDVDTGGVDQGMTGQLACCECYQLVFDAPNNEYDKHSPVPKPLVVQAFNTAAGGGQNFDVFMGNGGEGAYTSGCSSLYDTYPTHGEPNNGGIKFLSYPSCQDTGAYGEATPASISSAQCQSDIAADCDKTNSSRSTEIVSTTRDSCKRSNLLESLYHQNWKVWAKRVTCPEALTRVTGCKLAAEAGLAGPSPNVLTAAQAAADGTFKDNHTTTTMQDCCKPTCAWQEKVGGTEGKKNVSSPWTSFYTCDRSDQPQTTK
jgi:hypothetical protein